MRDGRRSGAVALGGASKCSVVSTAPAPFFRVHKSEVVDVSTSRGNTGEVPKYKGTVGKLTLSRVSGSTFDDRMVKFLERRTAMNTALDHHVGFPVYSLDDRFEGVRIRTGGGFGGGLRSMRDPSRLKTYAVKVLHTTPDGAKVEVISLRKRRFAGARSRRMTVWQILDQPVRLADMRGAAENLAPGETVKLSRERPTVDWRPGRILVDGVPVTCEVAELDGRWGVAAETPEVGIVVVGDGIAVSDVALVQIDSSALRTLTI